MSKTPYGDDFKRISEAEAFRILCEGKPHVVVARHEHGDSCQAPSGKPCTCNPVITYWLQVGGEA